MTNVLVGNRGHLTTNETRLPMGGRRALTQPIIQMTMARAETRSTKRKATSL